MGAKPIFVDIDPTTYLINVDKITEKITAKTKAIIPVSLYGLFSGVQKLQAISNKFKIPVIEDAAQSFGAYEGNIKSCSTFQMACTSFFPSKPLGCYGDGGAIFTNDKSLKTKLSEIRIHGQIKRYQHTSLGINGRLDTLQAAILLAKLEVFTEEMEQRQVHAKYYQQKLKDFKLQAIPADCTSAYAQFTLEVENRDLVMQSLQDAGIPAAIHYPTPIHRQPFYKNQFDNVELNCSDNAAGRILSIPFHAYLTKQEQDYVINTLKKAIKK